MSVVTYALPSFLQLSKGDKALLDSFFSGKLLKEVLFFSNIFYERAHIRRDKNIS